MRRLSIAIFLLLGQLAVPAWAQWTDEAQKCAETPDPALAFDLCTRAIQSGALSGAGLAITFNNRGNAYQSKGDYQRAIQD
ncbi:MAG TPA: tetratricopeptide repeat protein, partial [Methylomirabilota bacterium]